MLKKIVQRVKYFIPFLSIQGRLTADYNSLKYKFSCVDTGVALWEMDIDSRNPVSPGSVVIWSQEIRKMFGYKSEHDFPDYLYSWSKLIHPDDKTKTLEALASHIKDTSGKTQFDVEFRLMHKNGEYKQYRARGAALRNRKGAPIRLIGSFTDINDKSQLESMTKRHADTYEKRQIVLKTLHNLGAALLESDKSVFDKIKIRSMGIIGQVIQADRVQIWRNEMIGENLHFTLTDEWRSDLGNQLEQVPKCLTFPYEIVPGWEDRLRRGKYINSPVSEMLPHECSFLNRHNVKSVMMIPLFYSDSFWGYIRVDDCEIERFFSDEEVIDMNIVGQFIAFALMLSERMEEIKSNVEIATDMKRWYQSIIDAIQIPVSVTDADMKLTFVNAALERMFGKKRERLYGRHCSVLGTAICNTQDCAINCAKRYVNRTFFKSSGKSYQIDVSKLEDFYGETTGFVEVIQDITERRPGREVAPE